MAKFINWNEDNHKRFNGDYTGDSCPSCGRERIMFCQDGKRHCEKCWWCIEDEEYQGEFEVK